MTSIKSWILAVTMALPLSVVAEETFIPKQSFFEAYCINCHGPDKQKGDVRLDDPTAIDTDTWHLIYDQLVNGEMPPEEKQQPSDAERNGVIDYILAMGSVHPEVSSTGYRRLNKREYANTVRDLLGIKEGIFDPAELIYEDEIDEGFDTRAEELVISNELLLEFLRAAERSLRVALFSAERDAPKTRKVDVSTKDMKGATRRYVTYAKEHMILRVGGGTKIFDGAATRVMAAPGRYRITVTAEAVDRDAYKPRLHPASGPLKLGLGVINGVRENLSSDGALQAVFELKDNEPQTFHFETWIDEGFHPYLSFVNGSPKPIVQIRAGLRKNKFDSDDMKTAFRGPGIKVTEYRIEGPFNEQWPPQTFRITYGTNEVPDLTDGEMRQQLIRRFASRAFRRPIAADELTPYMEYLQLQYDASNNWHEAMIRTYAAIMGSVDFLYRREPNGTLDSFALVNRLSYFLWGTMPDPELFRLANTGEIQDPVVLKQQVIRLLDDERVQRFTRSFVDQWLSLDTLGEMPPDAKSKEFRVYYRQHLETAMLEETRLYFDYIFQQNESVRDFLDSDYSFINGALAEHYQVPFTGGKQFGRVNFPEGSKRGGLLGHASILTLTANGVDTSPVLRGYWVLNELLGTPPPPPPEEVPGLVPDLNGVLTVRHQLERHRADPACMTCHRKMDPPGFALEAFDPIGRYRTHYSKSQKIETDSTFIGQDFKDVDDFKVILMTQLEPFTRNLIIKIAEYAKGRKLEIADLRYVEEILQRTQKSDYRLKHIIAEIAVSELMTQR